MAELLQGIRAPDVDEFWAAARLTPAQALSMSLECRGDRWAALHEGKLLCIFGVARGSLLTTSGTIWLIGHRRIDRMARAFLVDCRPTLDAILSRYSHLSNYVDARNRRAIRWLQWLGFQIHPAAPHGAEGLPFHYFEKGCG
ncbi:hypothetical protein [Pseudoxanthomonas sp. X-1]|uniref:hypothetical protein n=1 Tax=Pseudoxanthomonas sp. X-1 TaxID=2571115 RepID=UPI00110BD31C|nr:hypothetical protein [Pseudoxanthomonas sp. X-1]TMN24498.1 hypothetical protein FF950_05300 [Pseudoxanthomonas sp. X-1]UAY75236.1 hypothetical protein LAJ50_02930 [Pseudoxanthomonas sp. X-1]